MDEKDQRINHLEKQVEDLHATCNKYLEDARAARRELRQSKMLCQLLSHEAMDLQDRLDTMLPKESL